MTDTTVRIVLNKFPDAIRAVTGKDLLKAATAGGYVIEGAAKINVEKTFKPSTGNLAGSIRVETVTSGETYAEVAVGPGNLVYGRIQELGGTIKPIKGKYLAIPADGTPKGARPRDYNDLSFIPSAKGGGVLVSNHGKGEVMFILKSSVTLPPRPYLRPAVDENLKKIEQAVSYQINKAIKAALK